jgi:divalent metal cation (Fe/Co/Zn/Cd) transporter
MNCPISTCQRSQGRDPVDAYHWSTCFDSSSLDRPHSSKDGNAHDAQVRNLGLQSYGEWVSNTTGAENNPVLLRRGRQLEVVTLSWNLIGVVVLAVAAFTARSVALTGFGIDSVIEIGASAVVLWELADVAQSRQRRALTIIGISFVALSVYLAVQSTVVLVIGFQPHHSPVGIAWTALTAAVMFVLANGKSRIGVALNNPVLKTEGRVTMIDGVLATAVLLGLALNALFGWWWADPLSGYVILYYAIREARATLRT